MNDLVNRLRDAVNSREFYELMQAYRHSDQTHRRPAETVEAFEAVKQFVVTALSRQSAQPADVAEVLTEYHTALMAGHYIVPREIEHISLICKLRDQLTAATARAERMREALDASAATCRELGEHQLKAGWSQCADIAFACAERVRKLVDAALSDNGSDKP